VVPGRSDLLTSGIDVAPTVLAALGLAPEASMPAVDLRTGKGLDPARIVYSEASLSARDGAEQWRCAVQGTTKWVLGVRKGNCESSRRIYDLAADPGELTIKDWSPAGDAPQSLLRLCREDPDPAGIPAAWAFGRGLKGPKLPDMREEERLKSLKALGYAD
jgi:arylsulfatase A-like enzyme